MEGSCYKCGQPVEEGVRFCPHCAAPQIRVVIAESPAATQVIAAADPAAVPASPLPELVAHTTWSQAVKPCALAALVAAFLMGLNLNALVAMFSAGFLAVVFHRQSYPGVPMKASTGAKLGALSGVFWFAMSSILGALVALTFHKGAEIRQQLILTIDQAATRTNDPQVLAAFERFKTPEGLELLMILGLIMAFLAAIVLAAIGGALGGSILGRKNRA
jgi:hypothetical protein